VSAISSEGVTPPSSLLRAHVPLPLGSLLLRHLASFEESWQVVRSPCCPRELPDVISESLSLDAGSRTPAVHPCALTCFFHDVIGLPQTGMGRLPAYVPRITTSREPILEVADIPLCSGLQVCSPPRSFLPLRILPQGSRGFYIRAYRALLPPHAPDMLTVRTQVIDGTGTCTLPDFQPCRLLTLPHRPSPNSQRVGCSTSFRSTTSERGVISRLQSFVDLQASEFAATQVVPTAEHPYRMFRAAVAFTSEHSAVCYLPAHRIC
jgi:hypothetical protein